MASDAKVQGTKQAAPLFAARLTPHRALSLKGRKIVIAVMASLSVIPALAFMRMGAWPVVGFMIVIILAVWFALAWSTRDGRRFEQVTLWADSLEILQVDASGRVRRSEFNPFFVRLIIERDFDERTTGIRLRTRESDTPIGAFLNPEDKASFAKVFGTALKKARG